MVKKISFSEYLSLKLSEVEKSSGVSDHIFLACQPKSGSTFLSNLIASYTGYKKVKLHTSSSDNFKEFDIDLGKVINYYKIDTVTQQHARASEENIRNLKIFNAKVIVLTRNIFDVVISSLDHAINYEIANSTMLFDNGDFHSKSKSDQLDMIIDIAVPWHFNFYASWYDAARKNKIEIMWITYEDLINEQNRTFMRIFDFIGHDYDYERITECIEKIKKDSRYNRGISGRGDKTLSKSQKGKILSYSNYYPKVDFGNFGIS